MKTAVKRCWENLFYPLPENCIGDNELVHNYLSSNVHAEIQNEINQLYQSQAGGIKLADLLKDIEDDKTAISRLKERIEHMENSGQNELVQQLKETNIEISKIDDERGPAQATYEVQLLAYNKLKKEIERLQDEIDNNSPNLQKSQRAKKVMEAIEKIKNTLLERKVQSLSQAATEINRRLAHDERIHRIEINQNGNLRLFAKNGEEISLVISAGQMQILIMSLVAALAKVTQYDAPMVIDTPLARLDDAHREALFEHWTGLRQQVILLSQDAEITGEIKKRLETNLSRSYLIRGESLPGGGARSNVTADAYFE